MKKTNIYVKCGLCAAAVLGTSALLPALLNQKKKPGKEMPEPEQKRKRAERPKPAEAEPAEAAAEPVRIKPEAEGLERAEMEAGDAVPESVEMRNEEAEPGTLESVEAEPAEAVLETAAASESTAEEEPEPAEEVLESAEEGEAELGSAEAEPEAEKEDSPQSAEPEPAGKAEKKSKRWLRRAGFVPYVLLILVICILPLALLGLKPPGISGSSIEDFLRIVQAQAETGWDYMSTAGDYFTEHFAARQELVSANSEIRLEVFGVSSVDDVIVGENGWLYYEATLDDYQHKNGVSERMLFNMAHNTALMQEYAESLGKTLIFTIAPNKNSLYDENMPERLQFQVAEKSDAERLGPWLERENVNYVNLFELFEEQEEVLYYARDSHWNEKGAVMVYNALLDACGKPHETYGEASPSQKRDYLGDLEVMLYPSGGRLENRLQYPVEGTWYYTEGEKVEDQFIRTENELGEGNLLMYRDSFGNSLLPYMAQTFSQAVFSKQVPYPMSDLVTCEPDIVIVEKVERHLPTLGTVPPLMSAPLRVNEKSCVRVKSNAATVQLSKAGSYWKFEGNADPAYMDTDSRIYVEVDDGSGADLYEAFCVSTSGGEGSSTDDYGYMLYLSEVLTAGDTFDIRIMIEQGDAMLVLLEKEIHE